MRITLINQYYVPDISPTAQLSGSLAEGLATLGHEVTIVASRGGYVAPAKGAGSAGEKQDTVRRCTASGLLQLGKKASSSRRIDYICFYLFASLRMVRLPAQDVIISLTTPPYIAWTGVFHRLLHPRARLVLWNMDCYPDAAELAGVIKKNGAGKSSWMRAMNRALFSRLDHLICLDVAMRDLLVPQYGPKNRELPVSVVPNWERLAAFPAEGPGKAGLEKGSRFGTRGKIRGPVHGEYGGGTSLRCGYRGGEAS